MRLPRIGILLTLLALVPANRASAQEQETDLADGPVFVARDTEPVLKNQTAVLQMLGRVYPNQLRLTGQPLDQAFLVVEVHHHVVVEGKDDGVPVQDPVLGLAGRVGKLPALYGCRQHLVPPEARFQH